MASSPSPPSRRSLPAPPCRMSLPPRPFSWSLPPLPEISSDAGVPSMTSSSSLPVNWMNSGSGICTLLPTRGAGSPDAAQILSRRRNVDSIRAARSGNRLGLKEEVPRTERSRIGQSDLDDKVGEPVTIGVALDEPVRAVLVGAKLAGDIVERVRADEGEGAVAVAGIGIGVDPGEIDPVDVLEVENAVDASGRRLGGGLIDETVRAGAAAQLVGADTADQEV